MSAAESQSEVVLALAEEFLDRYRRGERPPLKEYTDRHPNLAAEIRDVFPAMALMENIALVEESIGAEAASRERPRPEGLQQLGDFRIIREVGQGGMGVVYEAEQVSLGRHVALKLLPRQVIRDAKLRQRFEREAKSAARLHHTNIVPVYGVGEHDGTPYYVMQFIHGLGLDEVIAELARMTPSGSPPTAPEAIRRSGAARAAARSMMTGEFGAGAHDQESDKPDPAAETLTAAGALLNPPPAEAPVTGSGHGTARRVDTAVLSSVTLPGQSESGIGRKSRKLSYWQSVARVGVQVADALEHAHRQGVIHRDVKPSNLLLDLAGTVWVTDFGLAKADDQQNLTHTGDILGTLRYMPPEAFDGRADARGDIYSLGLTLYELVALRPAFDEKDRLTLIRRVTDEDPPPLRKLRPDLPRDLETIICKAIEKSPVHRYQTATDLAADLQRFLDDEPIQARRTTTRERVWRWCRRHPVEAALMTAVQLALVGLVLVAVWSNAKISRALADKGEALAETEKSHDEAVKARDAAVAETYRALLSETKALRLAHASGWRHQALQKLRTLALLETPQRDLTELRSQAIACIGEFDAHEIMRIGGHTAPIWSLDFSPDGTQLVTAGYDGRLQFWDVAEGRHAREISDPAANRVPQHNLAAPLPAVRFHAAGTRLAYATWDHGVELADVGAVGTLAVDVGAPGAARYLAFDRQGKLLAVAWNDGRVGLYDAKSGKPTREVQATTAPNFYYPVALNPAGDRVAVIGSDNMVQLYPVAAGREPVSLGRHRGTVRALCFSPSGDMLASASEDHTAKLWDVGGQAEPLTLLGHTARVNSVAFSPDGQIVATGSDDHTIRLWETRSGQSLMVLRPGISAVLCVGFGPDGARLAAGGSGPSNTNCEVSVYQLTSRQELRKLAGHTYQVHGMTFHPVKSRLASASGDKTVIEWDLQTGRPLRQWPAGKDQPVVRLAYAPAGDLLAVGIGKFANLVGRDFAVELLDVETGTVKRRLVAPSSSVDSLAFDPTGKQVAAGTQNGNLFVWDLSTDQPIVRAKRWLGRGRAVKGLAFLRGGSRLVTANTSGSVDVRDVSAESPARQISIGVALTCLAAAPDERVVAVGGIDGALRLLSLPDLTTVAVRERAHDGEITSAAFTPDGRVLATGGRDGRVILWDGPTCQRLCALAMTSGVDQLAFDPDGLRLAVSCAENLVTLWNLALVRPELAAVGLDWNAPTPETTLQPGALAATQPPPAVVQVRSPLQPNRPAAGSGASEPDLLYSQGRYGDAIAAAEAAVKVTPQAKAFYLTLARAYYHVGQYDKAADAARRHLDLCPNCGVALDWLANARAAAGAPDEAIQILEQALQRDPNQAPLSNNLARYYVTGPEPLRDPARALSLAQRAVALTPTNLSYQQILGIVYYRLGKFDKAAETLRAVSGPTAPKAKEAITQSFLAMTYQRLGDAAKAKAILERAPRLSPEDRVAPADAKELDAIRTEAAALLGIK